MLWIKRINRFWRLHHNRSLKADRQNLNMIIAIDGPAGAGKSSVARAVAQQFHFAYIDSGAMYRALALAAREAGLDATRDAEKIVALAQNLPLRFEDNGRRIFIGARDVSTPIRAPGMGEATSQIAAIGAVRPAIVAQQQRLGRDGAAQNGGAVLEGRDIQTVVFPNADLKIFLTATPRTRAERRLKEWQHSNSQPDLAALERVFAERDERDATRADSPLRAADDAVHLPTDLLSAEQVVAEIAHLVQQRLARKIGARST
jgi:cytidylate kinase